VPLLLDAGNREESEKIEQNIWNAVPTKVLYQRQTGMSKPEKEALEKKLKEHKLKDDEDTKKPEKDILQAARQNTLARREAQDKNSVINEVEEDVKKYVEPCLIKLKVNKDTK
jgi:hypothetical protein